MPALAPPAALSQPTRQKAPIAARQTADRGFRVVVVSDACTELSQEMHEAALELAGAAKKKDAAAIKTAASKVDAKCTSCHDVFKD